MELIHRKLQKKKPKLHPVFDPNVSLVGVDSAVDEGFSELPENRETEVTVRM